MGNTTLGGLSLGYCSGFEDVAVWGFAPSWSLNQRLLFGGYCFWFGTPIWWGRMPLLLLVDYLWPQLRAIFIGISTELWIQGQVCQSFGNYLCTLVDICGHLSPPSVSQEVLKGSA